MTYFAGGEKNVGLRLFADLMRVCPKLYLIMAEENSDGRRTDPSSDTDTSGASDTSDSGADA
jgi:hypothetical protein